MRFIATNPYDLQVLASYDTHNVAEVERKLQTAQAAYKQWSGSPQASHRRDCFERLAGILTQQVEELAQLITLEMGKPITEARAEVLKCADACRYVESSIPHRAMSMPHGQAWVQYQPIGVVLAVMPWNFPFWQLFRFATTAIALGNVALLKHAPNVPQCALALERVFLEAGFPEGVLQAIFVDLPAIEQLVSDPRVVACTLTGSVKAGQSLATLAGKYGKKCVLELGGSDPFLVFEDAQDLKLAASKAVAARMVNTGQSCIAAKRFLVQASIFEPFVQEMKVQMESLRSGNPLSATTDYGPLASLDFAHKLAEQVVQATKEGAYIVTGGQVPHHATGAQFQPTILTQTAPSGSIWREEIFGPVALIVPFQDELQAIALANDSVFGLGSSVWTSDMDRALRLTEALETGAVYVNQVMVSDRRLPFGGVKQSGYGKELGLEGMHEFINAKAVWMNG